MVDSSRLPNKISSHALGYDWMRFQTGARRNRPHDAGGQSLSLAPPPAGLTGLQQARGGRVNCRRLQVPATTFTERMNKSGLGPETAAAGPTGAADRPSASRTIALISPVSIR